MKYKCFKYIVCFIALFSLSGCGFYVCDPFNSDANCSFFAQVNLPADQQDSIAVPIPDLPDINTLDNDSYVSTTVFIPAGQSSWTDTGLRLNAGQEVIINIASNSQYASGENFGENFVANGTINQCYKSHPAKSLANSKDSQYTAVTFTDNYGPISILGLFNASNPNKNWQYLYTCCHTDCNSLGSIDNVPSGIGNCSPNGFDWKNSNSASSGFCIARDGQGLHFSITDANDTRNAIAPDASTRLESLPNTLDSTTAKFINGSVYYNASSGTPPFTVTAAVPYFDMQNICANSEPPTYATNYNVHYVSTGCFFVNGMADTTPKNSNAGQLRYFVGWNPSINDQGTFLTAQSNNIINANTEDNEALYLQLYESNNPADYFDNVGYYEVTILTRTPPTQGFVNSIISQIVPAVKNEIQALSRNIFLSITSDKSGFRNIVNVSLTLYIIVYAISFLIGAVKISQHDIVVRLVKIGIVLALFSKSSYSFFNEYLFDAFTGGLGYLALISSGGSIVDTAHPENDLFHFATVTMSYLTNMGVVARILAYILLPQVGWFIFGIICSCLWIFAMAVIEAFIAYLLALTGLYIFISLAPFFIVLILFRQTKSIFDNWINVLTGLVLQTAILFSCIALINDLALSAFNNLLLESQYRCILPVYLPIKALHIDLFCFLAFIPNITDLTLMITLCIILYVLVTLMKKLPEFVRAMSNYLTSGLNVSDAAHATRVAIGEGAKAFMGLDKGSKDRRKEKAADDKAKKEEEGKATDATTDDK